MVIDYAECLEKFNTKYNLEKQVSEGNIYKIEKGIYSDRKQVPEYQIISKKYPKAVFTLDSAFYYRGLTDVIPKKYYLMTDRGSAKITDKRVVQIFENNNILYLGAEKIDYCGDEILTYSKERLLLELLRNKNKLSFDYYKELIGSYRKIIHNIDLQKIQDMLVGFPKSNMIKELLELEVL